MRSLAPRSFPMSLPVHTPPATIQSDPFLGRVLVDRYDICALAGKGSYGNVYRARDKAREVDVAVKVLLPWLVTNQEALIVFSNEQHFSAQVHHPQIVPLLDVGRDLGTRFMVFDYYNPRTLQDFLDSTHFIPIRAVRNIGIQLMKVLIACHEADIEHRDIKPANLLYDQAVLRLIDFGIARSLSDPASSEISSLGTKDYSSPERLRGSVGFGYTSDIYSVGVILYQLITGTLPRSYFSLGVVPISRRFPSLKVHPDLENVVVTALDSDPNKRFQSMREMLDAFLACDCWPPEPVSTPLSRKDKYILAGVGAVLSGTFIATITAAILLSNQPQKHTSNPPSRIIPVPFTTTVPEYNQPQKLYTSIQPSKNTPVQSTTAVHD
ncbi:MAG: serine/threonine-protein kinase [Candidatus Micrarchaeota archaeon]